MTIRFTHLVTGYNMSNNDIKVNQLL